MLNRSYAFLPPMHTYESTFLSVNVIIVGDIFMRKLLTSIINPLDGVAVFFSVKIVIKDYYNNINNLVYSGKTRTINDKAELYLRLYITYTTAT